MKFENTKVYNFEGAIRGMRNPKESWDRIDSKYDENGNYIIGPNDLKLMTTLINAGNEHRKFMRQIFVCVDITAPLCWYKEFDTYSVGVCKNSTSSMHKIMSKEFTEDMFEKNPLTGELSNLINIGNLETTRKTYLKLKEQGKDKEAKAVWYNLIYGLPDSWLQTRTVTLNYENILSMIHQRKNHKQNCWSGLDNENFDNFIAWTKALPYANELLYIEEKKSEKNN